MFQSFTKYLTAAVLGVVVSMSTVSWAMGPGVKGMHDPSQMVSHMSKRLDLSEEQREQARAIFEDGREQSAADHKRLRQLRSEMKSLQGDFDENKARKIADEIGDITSRMVYNFSSNHAEFYQLLTDEQREKMDSLMEKRGEHRGKHHKHARGERQ